MENAPYVYKPPGQEGIRGWLSFYLVVVALGILLTGVTTFLNFNIYDYDAGAGHLATFIFAAIDVLFVMSIMAFGVFVIYSFIKRNPNAPTYGIIYCSLLLYSNIIFVLLSIVGDYFEPDARSEVQAARSLIWCIVWILYLKKSKQVQELYPKEKRKMSNPVLLVAFTIVFLPLLSFIIGVFLATGWE